MVEVARLVLEIESVALGRAAQHGCAIVDEWQARNRGSGIDRILKGAPLPIPASVTLRQHAAGQHTVRPERQPRRSRENGAAARVESGGTEIAAVESRVAGVCYPLIGLLGADVLNFPS